ncbi:endopeptidase La [Zavarzinia sp. CC-PAN008]|uniref:endopeptidase La n=1 Tax=Zavarzinia sp. CC-PAN008 TaxID=3243332 RepID=UPI003F744F35
MNTENPKSAAAEAVSPEPEAVRQDLLQDNAQSLSPDAATASTGSQGLRPLPDDALILVPVRNMVLFPGVVQPISLGRQRSIAAAQEAVRLERPFGVIQQRDASIDEPTPADLYEVGTQAGIMRYLTGQDGGHHVIAQGTQRFRIREFLPGYPFLVARVELLTEPEVASTEIEARVHQLRTRAGEALSLLPDAPRELAQTVAAIPTASLLADMVAGFMDLKPGEKQDVLETLDIRARLDKVLWLLAYRIEVLRLSRDIGQQTRATMETRQREHLLREQLRTIQKELGEDEGGNQDLADLKAAIAKAQLPEDVEKHVTKELRRLERMPEGAGEHGMLRTYLDWMVELPWAPPAPKAIDVPRARQILDQDHFGLEKIKRRILEHLAVRQLNPEGKSPILLFVGPPGVGKTSLGQSIARAMDRSFQRVSLGGVHDEAEIRGHRRTYIGALPGNIIQAIRKAGARDAVIMLDEVDKLGRGIQGDPSSALLEVLDPEQNGTFRDNYLGVPFDLSRTVFIATANQLDTIPGPLRDRMEVIELGAYTEEEKLEIARTYLVKRQREANGVKPEQASLDDDTLRAIIRDYTRESGVRNLEREIGSVFRRIAMRIAEGEGGPIAVQPSDLHGILGPVRFEREAALRTAVPGVATGLAWTPVGGDILFVEATRVPGSGRLILTGQLGDVMKESAQAALSLVKARGHVFGLRGDLFEKHDIHIHVPAGATPKDGPSAGVAIFTALVSLLSDRRIQSNVAMTGEISLRGQVLPVGGIKEKVVAAVRAGITKVMLPARNRRDLEEIPETARSKVQFVWLDSVDQAIAEAIGPDLAEEAKAVLEAASPRAEVHAEVHQDSLHH